MSQILNMQNEQESTGARRSSSATGFSRIYFNDDTNQVETQYIPIISNHGAGGSTFDAILHKFPIKFTEAAKHVTSYKQKSTKVKYLVGPSLEICQKYAKFMKFNSQPLFLFNKEQLYDVPRANSTFIFIRGKGFDYIEQKLPIEDFVEYKSLIEHIKGKIGGWVFNESGMTHPEYKEYRNKQWQEMVSSLASPFEDQYYAQPDINTGSQVATIRYQGNGLPRRTIEMPSMRYGNMVSSFDTVSVRRLSNDELITNDDFVTDSTDLINFELDEEESWQ